MIDFDFPKPAAYDPPKCCCVLVADISASMGGKSLSELNRSLLEIHHQILCDDYCSERIELGLVTFRDQTQILFKPQDANELVMPVLNETGAHKNILEAVREAVSLVRERVSVYKASGQSYYRSLVILITDGQLDADQDPVSISKEISALFDRRDSSLYILGVGEARMDVLTHLSIPYRPPVKLRGFRISELVQPLQEFRFPPNAFDVTSLDPPEWMDNIEID